MNGTMLSQIVLVMFLAHNCLLNVAKNCQKESYFNFHVNCYTGSDDLGSDNMSMVNLAAGKGLVLFKSTNYYIIC